MCSTCITEDLFQGNLSILPQVGTAVSAYPYSETTAYHYVILISSILHLHLDYLIQLFLRNQFQQKKCFPSNTQFSIYTENILSLKKLSNIFSQDPAQLRKSLCIWYVLGGQFTSILRFCKLLIKQG